MTPIETLKSALEILRDPKHHTDVFYAADKHGNVTDPFDPSACSFCMFGAMVKAAEFNYNETDDHRPSWRHRDIMAKIVERFSEEIKLLVPHLDLDLIRSSSEFKLKQELGKTEDPADFAPFHKITHFSDYAGHSAVVAAFEAAIAAAETK
ncbi:hypothetical protein [Achromobacter phage Motura]|uniref:Uncharacterized protein n=1 Tax=Achromobacter phage Motura TaxID=2591403 RepID=A0A514CSW2_9CAUD|nr:hypothetical protein H1O15_gp220 [Achromobacter phage Motura]QDH83568.1 hypothetical protein [Achromobacter phage Motura]